jgi:hypothetical protein
MLLDIDSFPYRAFLQLLSRSTAASAIPAVTFTVNQYVQTMSEIAYLIVRVPLPSAISVNTFAAYFLIEKPSSEAARSFVSPGFEPVKQSCGPR